MHYMYVHTHTHTHTHTYHTPTQTHTHAMRLHSRLELGKKGHFRKDADILQFIRQNGKSYVYYVCKSGTRRKSLVVVPFKTNLCFNLRNIMS